MGMEGDHKFINRFALIFYNFPQEGIGACLINNPEFVSDVVRQTKAKISDPSFSVSVKIRIHTDISRTVDLCRQIEVI